MSYTTKAIKGKDLAKAIKSIASRGRNLDRDTQICLIQSLIQIAEHSNFDYASKTIVAMGRSQKGKAAVAYILAHSPSRAVYKSKTFTGFKKDKSDSAVTINVAGAEQVDFWNYIPEKVEVAVTLASLEKRLERLVEAAKEHLNGTDLLKFGVDMRSSILSVPTTEVAEAA